MAFPKNQQVIIEEPSPATNVLPSISSNAQPALDFVSIGIACFAFAMIEQVGILPLLVERGYFDDIELNNQKKFKNLPPIKSALLSLCLSNVLIKTNGQYHLTALGYQLAKHIGLITMVFEGYGELIAKGVPIAFGKIDKPGKYLNGASIALSSIQFGEKVDPIVVDVVKKLQIKGTICDMGCGSAYRLLKLCKATSLPGLGLDASHEAVKIARKLTAENPLINIEKGDAENLEGIWEDVQVLMQCFMTHDIFPDEKFIQSLSSYRKNFPNLKYFIVIDIVAPEEDHTSHMPAFDYVHGLLGIETRKYDHFTLLFSKAGYKMVKEIQIDMPNTYVWVLKLQRSSS